MQKSFIKGLRKLKLLKRLNINFHKSINKHGYSIPLIAGNGEQNFIVHEDWMQEVLEKLVKIKKGAFIDVGANVGQTLLKVKSIDPAIIYYGFEPNPTCVFYLNQLIENNRFNDVTLFPVAIADQPKISQLSFFYNSDTDSAASMIENFRPDKKIYKKVFIPCFSIKDVEKFIDLSKVSIIKIDVEGAELEVLEGLSSVLQRARPFIVMEILPVYKEGNTERLNRQLKIQSVLAASNYKILRIQKEDGHLGLFETISEIGIHSNEDWCDYVLCPEETISDVLN